MESRDAQLKEQGNRAFAQQRYSQAVQLYTQAIVRATIINSSKQLNSGNENLFSNRALCYLRLAKYHLALLDAEHLIEINPNNIKGWYYQSQSLMELHEFDRAIQSSEKAMIIAKGTAFEDNVHVLYRKIKTMRWNAKEKIRAETQDEFQNYLSKLITDQIIGDNVIPQDGADDEKQLLIEMRQVKINDKLNELNTLFLMADERRKIRNVPEYFLCKITFEIMRDPVMTKNGVSYEKVAILEHLKKNGPFDPLTREQLDKSQLIQNIALKEAIEDFLDQNAWAADY